MIKVENLFIKNLSAQLILDDVSCFAPAGRITTLIGKSGAGKTTLLRAIAKLNKLEYQGYIEVDGKNLAELDVCQRSSLLGFVFQDFNLFENMTVLENCLQPLVVVKKLDYESAQKTAVDQLAALSLDKFFYAYPKTLSGGQKQRVAIARALCMGSKTLLLDEPTSALDPENTANLVKLIKELCQQGLAVLISSQDMSFVRMIMDRVYLLEDGKIVEFMDKSDGKALNNWEISKFIEL